MSERMVGEAYASMMATVWPLPSGVLPGRLPFGCPASLPEP